MQNKKVIAIERPSTPLISTVHSMHHGTITDAFWTSSAIWQGPSYLAGGLAHISTGFIANLPNERKIAGDQSHKPSQTIAVPASNINKVLEDERSGRLLCKHNQRDHDSEESQGMKDQDYAFDFREPSCGNGVDEDTHEKCSPHE